jgi:hypothetical protein
MAVLVSGCFNIIFVAGQAVATGKVNLFGPAVIPDFTSLVSFFTPLIVAKLLFNGVVSGLITAILTGANVRAYAQLKAKPLVA